uniref:Uncharacterized protein n=1 Tax=Amphimedon queenslandica TaxID=400682 RepID=A0A1X7VAM7_AMPQE
VITCHVTLMVQSQEEMTLCNQSYLFFLLFSSRRLQFLIQKTQEF